MRAALFGAGWAMFALGLAGLVITAAALGRNRTDDGWDFAAWTVELFGPAALLGEVAG